MGDPLDPLDTYSQRVLNKLFRYQDKKAILERSSSIDNPQLKEIYETSTNKLQSGIREVEVLLGQIMGKKTIFDRLRGAIYDYKPATATPGDVEAQAGGIIQLNAETEEIKRIQKKIKNAFAKLDKDTVKFQTQSDKLVTKLERAISSGAEKKRAENLADTRREELRIASLELFQAEQKRLKLKNENAKVKEIERRKETELRLRRLRLKRLKIEKLEAEAAARKDIAAAMAAGRKRVRLEQEAALILSENEAREAKIRSDALARAEALEKEVTELARAEAAKAAAEAAKAAAETEDAAKAAAEAAAAAAAARATEAEAAAKAAAAETVRARDEATAAGAKAEAAEAEAAAAAAAKRTLEESIRSSSLAADVAQGVAIEQLSQRPALQDATRERIRKLKEEISTLEKEENSIRLIFNTKRRSEIITEKQKLEEEKQKLEEVLDEAMRQQSPIKLKKKKKPSSPLKKKKSKKKKSKKQ